jgi:hypothetical protein
LRIGVANSWSVLLQRSIVLGNEASGSRFPNDWSRDRTLFTYMDVRRMIIDDASRA